MAWTYLILAGFFEIGFTTCLKLSENFTKQIWSAGFFISISLSFIFLNRAIAEIPLGTAYAVWTGIGAVGTVITGIVFFAEPLYFMRIFFLSTLIGSIVGLKVVS
jgi:quaternary ammonium compound-resistance protein SugE